MKGQTVLEHRLAGVDTLLGGVNVADRAIRTLVPGEQLPPGNPRKYLTGDGYVRLRWRVGNGKYVETYEHRVSDGRVVEAEHVHHLNRIRDDNSPENLLPVSAEDHKDLHDNEDSKINLPRAKALYEAGISQVEIGALFGVHSSAISRALRRYGVVTRPSSVQKSMDYLRPDVLRLHAEGARPDAIAKALGCSSTPVRRLLSEAGIPSYRPGRPSTAAPCLPPDLKETP